MSQPQANPSEEIQTMPTIDPSIDQYVRVNYEGGFQRTGWVRELDREKKTALVEFHYSIHGKDWFPWSCLS